MNTETMLHVIGQIDEDLVQDMMGEHRRIKHFSFRRIACIAAAVMITAFSAVLVVGANSGWDYIALFRQYFGIDEEQVYDFSSMGQDIHQIIEADGVTVHFDSMIADENSVFILYDAEFADNISKQNNFDSWMDITLCKPDGTTAQPILGANGVYAQNGNTVQFCLRMTFSEEDELEGSTLQLHVNKITTSTTPEEENTFPIDRTVTLGMDYLQDVVTCEVIPDPYIQATLGARLESVKLTPLRLQMEFARFRENQSKEEWVNNCYAIMQDGTQVQLLPFNAWEGGSSGGITTLGFYLDTPINTEEVTALLLNGTEVPIE